MEKGFYLLQPEKVKYFEGLLEAIDTIEKCGMQVCFLMEKTNTEGKKVILPFSVLFKIVENEKEFFVRMRTRILVKGFKLLSDKLVPSSNNAPKGFFTSIRNYLDQKLKKGKLTDAILSNEELHEAIICYEEVHYQKDKAVELKNFDESPRLAEEEVKLITKIIEVTKKEICILPGFKWVTDNHILDILEV